MSVASVMFMNGTGITPDYRRPTRVNIFDEFEKIQPKLEEIELPLNSPNDVYFTKYADGFLTVSYNGSLIVNLSKVIFGELFSSQFVLHDFLLLSKDISKEYVWRIINRLYADIGQAIEDKRKYLYNKGELT